MITDVVALLQAVDNLASFVVLRRAGSSRVDRWDAHLWLDDVAEDIAWATKTCLGQSKKQHVRGRFLSATVHAIASQPSKHCHSLLTGPADSFW